MKSYRVEYRNIITQEVEGVDVLAQNKAEAWAKAVYRIIPQKTGYMTDAWVASVTYQNGNCKRCNNNAKHPY